MNQELMPAVEPDYDGPELELHENLTERLNSSQKIRTKVVSSLTRGGTKAPRTDEELKMLLVTLRDMDSVTLGEMKVKVEANNKGQEEIVKAVILEMAKTRGRVVREPVAGAIEAPVKPLTHAPSPELEEDLELLPDEAHIGQQSLTYDDFRERFGK